MQIVFEAVDLLPQALALVALAISLAFQFAAQARVFTLLPFQFGNQFFA
jgi:hypothetical protein